MSPPFPTLPINHAGSPESRSGSPRSGLRAARTLKARFLQHAREIT
jgi:hypothetical protein